MSALQAELYDALVDAGTSEQKARAAAKALARADAEGLATKRGPCRIGGQADLAPCDCNELILTAIATLAIFSRGTREPTSRSDA